MWTRTYFDKLWIFSLSTRSSYVALIYRGSMPRRSGVWQFYTGAWIRSQTRRFVERWTNLYVRGRSAHFTRSIDRFRLVLLRLAHPTRRIGVTPSAWKTISSVWEKIWFYWTTVSPSTRSNINWAISIKSKKNEVLNGLTSPSVPPSASTDGKFTMPRLMNRSAHWNIVHHCSVTRTSSNRADSAPIVSPVNWVIEPSSLKRTVIR